MSKKMNGRVVYVVGAGLSAGLGFPTIHDLLPKIRTRLGDDLFGKLSDVIRFHHPSFNVGLDDTYPNVEQLLSEMEANVQLFRSSRPAIGNFTKDDLNERRRNFLLEMANWFHALQASALKTKPTWLKKLVEKIKTENAQIVSFNWDLVLDELMFGDDLKKENYGFGRASKGPRLIKPHGSLNWYENETGRFIKRYKKISLAGSGGKEVFAFTKYRAPKSSRREYMPLIVPPMFQKQFQGALFENLWRETVAVLSTASEVRFLGYSLPEADFHARFILRCGFYNQEHGVRQKDGSQAQATGRAKVTIVDPVLDGPKRIEEAVGWSCVKKVKTIEKWIEEGGLE